ncbi:GHKL domain-containing protein [Ruminococcus sp. OA3]|uniref:sensor histidine kinase n=1 Tax=Ruminococcus sp. OA3 TaxID=2914164 RepID=UPI001F063FD7|nr:sensor histidine kinase [Ruminococcus sp. OA3]MCH1981985.1 GHKL domain-containing protein [Ruminococcus sp. OA3]
MLNTIEFIVNWILSMTYGTLLFLILRQFIPLRRDNRFLVLIEIFLITYLSNAIIYPGEITGTFGAFAALIIILFLFHRSDLYLKLSVAVLLFPIIAAVSYILQDIGSLIWMYGFNRHMSPAGQTILHSFTMMLRIPVWFVIWYFMKKWIPCAVCDLTRKIWFLIDLVSLASFIGIITVIYNSTSQTSYIAYPACIASLITNLGCCCLCTHMAKTVRTEMQLESYQYQQAYYQEMESNQQAIRGLRHDMKNHLNIVSTLLQNESYDKAGQYLNRLNQEFITTAKNFCPNSTVNAVLSTKEQFAKDHGIHCHLQVDLDENLPIDDIDLCSLFANTLDNAIESCLKIQDVSKRFLNVKTRCNNNYFSYEIVNSKENEIRETSTGFQTDKKDPELHGIGTVNIRRIVEKYHGAIDIQYTQDRFTVVILIQTGELSFKQHASRGSVYFLSE